MAREDNSEDVELRGEQGSHRNLTLFVSTLTESPGLTLGFTFFWLWIWLIFQSLVFVPTSLTIGALVMPPWIVPLASYAITFFILGALYRSHGFVPGGRYHLLRIDIIMTVSVLTILILSFLPSGSDFLRNMFFYTCGVFAGAGTTLLHMEWGRMMGYLGTRKTIFFGITATVGAALCLLILNILPVTMIRICTLFLPTLSIIFLNSGFKRYPQALHQSRTPVFTIPWKFLTTSFIQGLSFGIFIAFLLMGGMKWPALPLSAASFAAAAVVVFIVIVYFKLDFNQLFYQVGFFLMAFGFLIFAIAKVQNIPGWFIQSVGYRVVDILMWALCAYLIKQRGLHTNWVFSWTTFALLIGQTTGALVGDMVLEYSITVPTGVSTLSIVMVFLLLGAALLLFNTKNIQSGWGMIAPGDEEVPLSNFDRSCAFICSEYNLTARESEIVAMLARGRNSEFICETLTLSKETVKTHIRNIYRKLDVHSRQDVMTLVEDQEHQFVQGEDADE